MRKFRLFGVLLLVLALFPVRSYAVDFWPNGSYWNGITSPGHYAAFVRADDIYGAAAYGLNKDPVSLSSDVRLKLSDPNYGGKFYEYAQTFYNVEGWPNMPEWVPTYVLATSVGLGQSFERVYASEVTTTLHDEALRDFERVRAGEDLGGGGSGAVVPVGGFLSLAMSSFSDTKLDPDNATFPVSGSAQNATYSDGNLVIGTGTTVYSPYVNSRYYVNNGLFYANSEILDLANSYIEQGMHVCFYKGLGNSCGLAAGANLRLYRYYDGVRYVWQFQSDGLIYTVPFSSTSYYNSTDGVFCFVPAFGSDYSVSSRNPPFSPSYFTQVYTSPFPTSSIPPGGTWPEPETPVTPTAPEQPTPTAPTVEPDPTVTEPTPTWPDVPTPTAPTVVTVDTPEGLDYTQLLTLINDNLNDINSYTVAINSTLNSLRSDLVTEFEGVTQGLRNIYQYLQHLDDLLERHCKHIRDSIDDNIYELELYLKDLFEWLPQQLDFDANFDYDDSGIKSYLQRILNKIPGGATGTPQTYMPNPQSDEPGFFDWLTDLWHRFLIDLVSVLPDELGGLVDAFSQLTHYFPFSIPWDLAALLALFEHEPVTPVFDVPWGFGGDEGEIEMVRVDLSAWDGVMEMVRPVFLVGFCWQLAMITKELLANFDINKGGV